MPLVPALPAPSPAVVGRRGALGVADAVVIVPNLGKISIYKRYSRLEAVYLAHKRSRCKLARCTGKGSDPDYGRPVGFAMLWLEWSVLPHTGCKQDHSNQFLFALVSGLLQEKQAARERVKALPNGQALCDLERPLEAGEPEEPLAPPMY